MTHLRPLSQSHDAILLPAPTRALKAAKGKGRADLFETLRDVLPSEQEMEVGEVYERQRNVPGELTGLNPDMDPHLRQVLEALEDEAFLDGEEEEWFDQLVGDGERGAADAEFGFEEWGVEEGSSRRLATHCDTGDVAVSGLDEAEDADEEEGENWERVKAFKKLAATDEVPLERSEMNDTLGSLVSSFGDMLVKGGKRRHGKRGPSDASGMSMSSASVYRNEGLRDLDGRYDQVSRTLRRQLSRLASDVQRGKRSS